MVSGGPSSPSKAMSSSSSSSPSRSHGSAGSGRRRPPRVVNPVQEGNLVPMTRQDEFHFTKKQRDLDRRVIQ